MGAAQDAMTSAYEKYRSHGDWNTRFEAEGLTGKEAVATILGNMNYQVENGGAMQWWDNGYALRQGPNGTSSHVVLAALASRHRAFDPEVADCVLALAAFIDPVPGLEAMSRRPVRWWDEDEEDDFEEPLNDHFAGCSADRDYCGIGQERRMGFLDRIVEAFPEGEDPFSLSYDFARPEPGPSSARHPHVSIRLAGEDGNAYSIIGRTRRAMERAGVPDDEVEAYVEEATSGDYDRVLAVTMRWVSCDEAPAASMKP